MLKKITLFGIAGSIGFLIDSGVLYLLKDSLGLYLARVISFLCAVFVTWLINRNTTFKKSTSKLNTNAEITSYLLIMLFGGVINYLIYSYFITYSSFAFRFPIIAVAAGSIGGMVINFISSNLLFRFKLEQDE